MSIWDEDEEIAVELEEEENIYLKDEEYAVKLLIKLLRINEKNIKRIYDINEFEYTINNKLINFLDKVTLDTEVRLYENLIKSKNKICEQRNINDLKNKSIVAVGGGFSSGKSKFINSIIKEKILPEDQTPTTSIPTYIINGINQKKCYTFNNLEVELDDKEVEAISHLFFDRYKISFTKILKNILISTNSMKYKNIVLLDTPGYTKAEGYKKANNTDETVAREHLKIADFLIWLADIENGTIKKDDIEFINKMNFNKPILIVFNKADKKIEKQIEQILNTAKETLENTQLNIYAITAYSSIQNKEYCSENYINTFLEIADKNIAKIDEYKEIEKLLLDFEESFKNKEKRLNLEKENLKGIINRFNGISVLTELSKMYSEVNLRRIDYINRKNEFKLIENEILKHIKNILQNY